MINKLDLRDNLLLEQAETLAFRRRYALGIPEGNLDYAHLKKIHGHLFQDIYDWAGQQRTINISKEGNLFAIPSQITPYIQKVLEQLKNEHYLEKVDLHEFTKRAAFYFGEINATHPFREGNGRTQRCFLEKIAQRAGYAINWSNVDYNFYTDASIKSFAGDYTLLEEIFADAIRSIRTKLSLVSSLL